jgi:hypothetical protein
MEFLIEALEQVWQCLDPLVFALIDHLKSGFFPSSIAELLDKAHELSQLVQRCKLALTAGPVFSLPDATTAASRKAVYLGWTMLRELLARLVAAVLSAPASGGGAGAAGAGRREERKDGAVRIMSASRVRHFESHAAEALTAEPAAGAKSKS